MAYQYTVPRRPIAAMYSSPGPCYGLPGLTGFMTNPHDPRSVHCKKPAYTFGLKPPLPDNSSGPGPKYLPPAKMYRDGWDGQPHYTMRRRIPPLKPFLSPGPGAYKPEKGFPSSTHPTAPSYSLRERTKHRSLDKTPAPNSYTLPKVFAGTTESTKNQAPCYTMRIKPKQGSFSEDLSKAPGPGTYDETSPSNYKRRLPIYTMGARVFPPGDTTIKPGPGAHRSEDVNLKRTYPAFSFGIRHSPYTMPAIMEPPLE